MSDLINRQDAINELYNINPSEDMLFVDAIVDMLENLPSVETEQRWIPVTERLPKKKNKSYWVCTDTKHQYECRWTNNIYGIGESNNWGWKIFDIPQYTKVLAWQPLPEPWENNNE